MIAGGSSHVQKNRVNLFVGENAEVRQPAAAVGGRRNRHAVSRLRRKLYCRALHRDVDAPAAAVPSVRSSSAGAPLP